MLMLEELDRREVGTKGNKVRFALFECDFCKSKVIRQKQNGLRDFSCGCKRYELVSFSNTIHGDSDKSSEYYSLFGIWAGMRDRCNRETHQDYKYYGAKGIVVDSAWDNYLEFKEWSITNGYVANKNLQIDRIDGSRNYSPNNCRWVTPKINQRNRDCVILDEDKANNIRLLISKGMPNTDIAKMYGVSISTISDIKRGKTWQH